MLPAVLKLLTPSVIKSIMDYVFKKNDLDYKVEQLIERVENLEKDSHPPKNWREIIRGLNEEIKILKEKLLDILMNFLSQEKMTIDGIHGVTKNGELIGMPVMFKLQGMMKTILKFVLILHGHLLHQL